jgi:hypothetical protein
MNIYQRSPKPPGWHKVAGDPPRPVQKEDTRRLQVQAHIDPMYVLGTNDTMCVGHVRDSSIGFLQSTQSLRSQCIYQTNKTINTPNSESNNEDDLQIHPGMSAPDFPFGASQPRKQPGDLQTPSKRPEIRVAVLKSLHHMHVCQTRRPPAIKHNLPGSLTKHGGSSPRYMRMSEV